MKFTKTDVISKVEPRLLLHSFIHLHETNIPTKDFQRINFSSDENSLQVASISMREGHTFKPHKHVFFERNMPIAQESWVVLRGKVKVYYYDLDDAIIAEEVLQEGDCTITYRGGHNYKAVSDDVIVYEIKTGPYLGQKADKEFII